MEGEKGNEVGTARSHGALGNNRSFYSILIATRSLGTFKAEARPHAEKASLWLLSGEESSVKGRSRSTQTNEKPLASDDGSLNWS